MTAKEMMVGDFLTFKDCLEDGNIITVEVAEIYETELLASIDGDGAFDRIDADDELVGIPLSPDFFLKNGFAHGEENELKDEYVFAENLKQIPQTVAEYTFYKHPISGCDSLLRCWTKCKDGDGQNDVHICNLRYVHELQHAFRLLGIVKDFRP